jgi:hypothetical protein
MKSCATSAPTRNASTAANRLRAPSVIPAQAGIQIQGMLLTALDSGLRRNDHL